MVLADRLPGIRFEVPSRPATPSQVRMDIAAFAGFAASGPVNRPVRVESISDFEEIFGADLALVQDDDGSTLYAYLAPAVRAFFRNGGTRCWVVRLAGDAAVANRLPIPGLSMLQSDALMPAYASARSEGSWSDGLVVSAALRSQGVQVTSFNPGGAVIGLALSGASQVGIGDLLRVSFSDGRLLWIFVDTITPEAQQPPQWTATELALARGSVTLYTAPVSRPPARNLPTCDVVTMDLFAQDGAETLWSLTKLGFSPLHPRYWAGLPTDQALYGSTSVDGLAAEAAHPRFPLAGLPGANYYIPDGLGALPTMFGAAVEQSAPAIARDGLATLHAGLFLDPALADSSVLDLLPQAFFLQYGSSVPRRLTGIHSLLPIDEVSILCVPDLVQRGWADADEPPSPAMPSPQVLQHPEWWHFLDCAARQSIPAGLPPQNGQFEPSGLQPIVAPVLTTSDDDGPLTLRWATVPGATDFLEEAADEQFASACVLYQGTAGAFTLYQRSPGDYYYRVRRQIGAASSDYSNGVHIRIGNVAAAQIVPAAAYTSQMLLDVQTAMLRMSAARGDLFTILSMPRHFSPGDALDYSALLTSAGIEPNALSYGGLYHPWLLGREESDWSSVRANPPDGAVAGVFAKRSNARGPWITPANELIKDVVALDPAAPQDYRLALQSAAVNLVRQEQAGFLCLCSATLSSDPDLQPINVRRLLSFLRKTALREGVNYVFEPNNATFRRGVQRGFEKLMDQLFQQGAFAGRVAGQGFQVIADNTLNTQQTMDAGQFFVELKVAPSLPMRFLTVRLVQTGDRSLVTEGS